MRKGFQHRLIWPYKVVVQQDADENEEEEKQDGDDKKDQEEEEGKGQDPATTPAPVGVTRDSTTQRSSQESLPKGAKLLASDFYDFSVDGEGWVDSPIRRGINICIKCGRKTRRHAPRVA